MVRLLALTGRDGVGKSSIAHRLRGNVRIVSFATPIKTMLAAIGIPVVDKDHVVAPELGEHLTVRYLLRTLGTEWGRQCVHPDWWVWLWRQRVVGYLADPEVRVVVDDLRYDNEAAEVRRLGGIVVRVVRPGVDRPVEHASDAGAVVPDVEVVNDRLDVAVAQVDRLFEER